MSFPGLAAIRAAYTLQWSGQTEPLIQSLNDNIRELYDALKNLQDSLPQPTQDPPPSERRVSSSTAETEGDHQVNKKKALMKVPTACPLSPIFSVETVSPRLLAKHCQDRGFVVRPIMPPTVPPGSERIRVCLHAGNTKKEIQALVSTVREWCLDQLGDRQAGEEQRAKL